MRDRGRCRTETREVGHSCPIFRTSYRSNPVWILQIGFVAARAGIRAGRSGSGGSLSPPSASPMTRDIGERFASWEAIPPTAVVPAAPVQTGSGVADSRRRKEKHSKPRGMPAGAVAARRFGPQDLFQGHRPGASRVNPVRPRSTPSRHVAADQVSSLFPRQACATRGQNAEPKNYLTGGLQCPLTARTTRVSRSSKS